MSESFVRIPATRAFFEDSKLKTQNVEQPNSAIPPLSSSTGSTNLAQFYRKRSRDQVSTPFMESAQFPAYSMRTITTKAGPRPQAAKPELSVSKENAENAFLRTVALRSSYRALNNKDEDEFDRQAKKLHISSTNFDVKEELKQSTAKKSNETKSGGGMGAFMNNIQFINNEVKSALNTPTKAKSGPEARQRYAPISINFPEPENTASLSTCQQVLREQQAKDRKSASMLKHIVSVQQSPREVNDLNFERSPRTVNLIAYKQRAYSVYEPDARAAMRFMETSEEKEAKLRKPVEKSRSFKLASNATNNNNNNMPSMPDLSKKESESESNYFAKTSPTQDKSVSLGFEINDNNLMRRSAPVAVKSQLKITPQTTSKSAMDLSSSKVLLPQNGGSSSNRDISEIEQNIDMIVKSSPFISIVERHAEAHSSKSSEDLTRATKTRPNRLSLKMEPSESLLNLMPMPVKDKEKKQQQRQSAPLMLGFKEEVAKLTKRALSQEDKDKTNLPEFLQIQLTPIDTAEKASEHVVLAKHVKSVAVKAASPSPSTSSIGTTSTSINSDSRDGSISPLSKKFMEMKRHDSNESIEIKEQTVAPQSPAKLVEAVNGDARAIVTNFLTRHALNPNTELQKQVINPVTPLKPIVHNLRSFSLQERRRMFLKDEPSKIEQKTVGEVNKSAAIVKKADLETKMVQKQATPNKPTTPNSATTPTTPTFKTKVEVIKTVVEKTKERQEAKSAEKSPTVRRRVNNESTTGFTTETKPRMPKPSATTASKAVAATTPTSETNETPAVVLRKKSASSQLPIAGKLQLASSPRKMSSRNDEPELMKVFARRSLKVKDEDVHSLNEKIQAHNYGSSRRTICGMDSDKENQSASIERLNKLMQQTAGREENEDIETNNNNIDIDIDIINAKNNNNNNGISISTPLSPTKVISPTHEHNKLNNNNNNNNNNITSSSFAKPKVDNLEANNGNVVQNGVSKKPSSTVSTAPPKGRSQAIQERATTMGEFKNINQRRAEWEQRAKGVKN